jgi:hypothetical protein
MAPEAALEAEKYRDRSGPQPADKGNHAAATGAEEDM